MDALANLHFLRPYALLLLLPALLIAFLLWRQRGQEGNWSSVVAPELLSHLISSDSVTRSRSAIPALIIAWCLGALAAAGPSWEKIPQPVLQKQDALVLVLDLSYSMYSTDMQPTRADRVRRKLMDLLRDRREGLTALIAYAGDAHIVAPLTDDNPTIANLLPALNPAMMPLPGSNPVEAIETALGLLDSAGVSGGRILLVTDGIDTADSDAIARRLKTEARQLAVLGVGTDVGAPIALPDGGFLRDGSGEIVVPAFDDAPIRALAAETGGPFERLSIDDSDLKRLLDDSLLPAVEDTLNMDRRADQWQDMAHWLVLPLLLFALASFRRGWIYMLPLALSLAPVQRSEALEWDDLWLRKDQQAQQALAAGDAERAANLFEDRRWKGSAAYEAGAYEDAASSFSAGDGADDWYNRGNALAAQGDYEEAIRSYEESLARDAGREDALKNIEVLKQLQEQQREQEQQQEQQQDQNQEQQENSDQESQDQQKQGGEQNPSQSEDSEDKDQQSQNSQDNKSSKPEDRQNQNSPTDQQGDPSRDEQQEQQDGSPGDADAAQERQQRPPPQPQIDMSDMQEDIERDQAMQQWLRRVPDDPSGLLREKFRYESRQRQQQGRNREPKKTW